MENSTMHPSKQEILALAHSAHALTESLYQQHPAVRGEPEWSDKQRILLADMSLHLLQTALQEGPISTAMLKRNLYSILTVTEHMIPGHQLGEFANQLYVPE